MITKNLMEQTGMSALFYTLFELMNKIVYIVLNYLKNTLKWKFDRSII